MELKVVHIGAKRNKELVDLLRHYLVRAEKGELPDLGLFGRDATGREFMHAAGGYLRHPGDGSNAAMRMCLKLAQLQETPSVRDSSWRPV